jgi:hypothetical protein
MAWNEDVFFSYPCPEASTQPHLYEVVYTQPEVVCPQPERVCTQPERVSDGDGREVESVASAYGVMGAKLTVRRDGREVESVSAPSS